MCNSYAAGRCDDVMVALLHSLLLLLIFQFLLLCLFQTFLRIVLKLSPLYKVFDFISALDFFIFKLVPQR